MRAGPAIVALGLVGAALLLTRRAQAASRPTVPPGLPLPWETGRDAVWPTDDTGTGWSAPAAPTDDTGTDWYTPGAPVEVWPSDDAGIDWYAPEPPVIDYAMPGGTMPVTFPGGPTARLVEGLLYAIRTAEVGRVPDAERYWYGYGYARFSDPSDHPVITGELRPVPLPERFCRAAGLSPGCVSTAAGAYQIIRPTWQRLRAAGRWGPRLPDFSPASQDEAARRLLIDSGVLRLLESGNIQGAILAAGRQWASLPGSTAGQGGISMSRALALVAEGSGGAVPGTITV